MHASIGSENTTFLSTYNLHLPAFYTTSSSENLSHPARILNVNAKVKQ